MNSFKSAWLLIGLLSGSCASIMNERTTKIRIFTDEIAQVTVEGIDYVLADGEKIRVRRGRDTLHIFARNDSLSKTFVLYPRNSFVYYSNALLTYGLGFIWDRKSDKRYTYRRNLYLDYGSDRLRRFRPKRKGQFDLAFSLPYINSFYMRPSGEASKTNAGFWGASAGLEYYYRNSRSLAVMIRGVSDFFVPVPAVVDISGEYELMTSTYISVTDNVMIGDFSVGYGFNYSKNNWDLRYYDRFDPPPPTRDPVRKSSQSIGVALTGYYRCGEHFNIGVIYRPTLLRTRPASEFVYEHLISLDLAWKWTIPQ